MKPGLYRIPSKCLSPVRLFFFAGTGDVGHSVVARCYGFEKNNTLSYVDDLHMGNVVVAPIYTADLSNTERERAMVLLRWVLEKEVDMIPCVRAQELLYELEAINAG